MKEKELFMASSGRDEYGVGKALIRLETKVVKKSGEEEILRETFVDYPEIILFRSGKFVMADIKFGDSLNVDFVSMRAQLCEFMDPKYSADEEDGILPVAVLTIMPKEYMGEYFISGMHPAWSFISSKVDGANDTIRFIFNDEDISSYEVDEEVFEKEEMEGLDD